MTAPPESSSSHSRKGSFGPNAWLVDDMYDRFLADPTSVAESWREFFADYQRSTVPSVATSAPPPAVVVDTPDIDAGRVAAVQQAIDSGQYTVSPERIAARLLQLEQDLASATSQ